MDVYDEVDRRETDAGKVKLPSKSCVVSLWSHHWSHYQSIIRSLVGYTESQHTGDGDNCGAFPSREPRVFINTKPGEWALQNSHSHTHLWCATASDATLFLLFRDDRSSQDLTHMNLQLSWLTY